MKESFFRLCPNEKQRKREDERKGIKKKREEKGRAPKKNDDEETHMPTDINANSQRSFALFPPFFPFLGSVSSEVTRFFPRSGFRNEASTVKDKSDRRPLFSFSFDTLTRAAKKESVCRPSFVKEEKEKKEVETLGTGLPPPPALDYMLRRRARPFRERLGEEEARERERDAPFVYLEQG